MYFKSKMYSCDGKAEFSAAITPVFSVTWSFRNHSNIPISAQEHFLLLSKLKTVFIFFDLIWSKKCFYFK